MILWIVVGAVVVVALFVWAMYNGLVKTNVRWPKERFRKRPILKL